jgi:hypothetical protein
VTQKNRPKSRFFCCISPYIRYISSQILSLPKSYAPQFRSSNETAIDKGTRFWLNNKNHKNTAARSKTTVQPNLYSAQMAIFLVRVKHGIAFVPPTATGIFPDVPVGSFGANYIEQLVADAITSGCGGGLYCPNTMVKRDSMAVFLVKTFGLP